MYPLTSAQKAIVQADSTHKIITVDVYGTGSAMYPADDLYPDNDLYPQLGQDVYVTFTNEDIVSESLKWSHTLCDDENLTFGYCNAAEVSFECASATTELEGHEMKITITYENEGGDVVIPLGIFKIDSVKRKSDKSTKVVTGYDRMKKFDTDVTDWWASLWLNGTVAVSQKDIRNSLLAYVGITLAPSDVDLSLPNDRIMVKNVVDANEISGKHVLEEYCEINGAFAVMNREGQLHFVQLSMSGQQSISTSLTKKLIRLDRYVPRITVITIRNQDNDVGASYGSGNNAYVIQDNFFSYNYASADLNIMASRLHERISPLIYYAIDWKGKGLPYIDVGDPLSVTEAIGSGTCQSLVLKRTFTGIQAPKDNFVANGSPNKRLETFSVNKSIVQLAARTNTLVRTVDETNSTVEQLGTGYTEISQKFDDLTLTAAAGDAKSTLTLTSGDITLTSADIVFNGVVTFQNLSEADGTTIINGDNITAGSITGRNFNAVFDSNGNVTGDIRFWWLTYDQDYSYAGGIRFDDAGTGDNAKMRLFVYTGRITNNDANAVGLKLQSGGNMSLDAGISHEYNGTDRVIAGKGVYIGTTNGTAQEIWIGNSSSTVRIRGTVYINGVLV